MFDHFKWEIDNERIKYPSSEFINKSHPFKEGQIEWEILEYELKSGQVNRKIACPNEEGMHDDSPNSDVLACWAADKIDPSEAPRRTPLPMPMKAPKLMGRGF